MISYHFQVSNVCRKVFSQTEDGLVVPYIADVSIITKSQYYPLKFWLHHTQILDCCLWQTYCSLTYLGPVIQSNLDKICPV